MRKHHRPARQSSAGHGRRPPLLTSLSIPRLTLTCPNPLARASCDALAGRKPNGWDPFRFLVGAFKSFMCSSYGRLFSSPFSVATFASSDLGASGVYFFPRTGGGGQGRVGAWYFGLRLVCARTWCLLLWCVIRVVNGSTWVFIPSVHLMYDEKEKKKCRLNMFPLWSNICKNFDFCFSI